MAIHAGKRHPSNLLDTLPRNVGQEMRRLLKGTLLETLPTGCVIGTGELIACHFIDEAFLSKLDPAQLLFGEYELGRYAWEYEKMHELLHLIPAKGLMRIWNWDKKDGL